MRRSALTIKDVAAIIASPEGEDHDDRGNRRSTGTVRGEIYRVVVAADAPDFVISIHPRRHV